MNTAVKLDQRYTYRDYLSWPDEKRWELIRGVPYDMSPAPAPRHQELVSNLVYIFMTYITKNGSSCRVYPAPFDVRFSQADDTETVVQPDISVICDPKKIDDKGCVGAPDLVVEILSPSTGYKDETEKFKLYEKEGVKEYWVVNPGRQTVEVFSFDGASYGKPAYYIMGETLKSNVLKDFSVAMNDIFRTWEETEADQG